MISKIAKEQFFSVTIFGYKKVGMDEDEYHRYVSDVHAGYLKGLLAKQQIVSYTMQHNTTATKALIKPMFGAMPESKIDKCDMVVQIVFRDVEDYVKVTMDPEYKRVVMPDHHNFADPEKTMFATGSFEWHVKDEVVV